ncbi:hypothetical protein [Streptomyces sp. NPDC059003]|uniref:hypothetical protein n=1 Tax=Streptomyces sp. NPDC059003 TaxID=3346691 RepID=UPI00368B8908
MSEPFIGRLLPWMNMADDLLGHANAVLADDETTSGELRYMAACLTESLRQVQAIAKSRGIAWPPSAMNPTTATPTGTMAAVRRFWQRHSDEQ